MPKEYWTRKFYRQLSMRPTIMACFRCWTRIHAITCEFKKKLTVMKPNCRELWALGGVLPSNNRADLVRVASTIMQDWEIENLVLTLAQDGILLFSRTGDPACSALPAVAREIYDVSGAGDTVIAVTAMALAAHAEIREAVLLGNLAAGIVVGKLGTSTVSSLEIKQELAKNNLS